MALIFASIAAAAILIRISRVSLAGEARHNLLVCLLGKVAPAQLSPGPAPCRSSAT